MKNVAVLLFIALFNCWAVADEYGWEIETVDSEGDVGLYTSIELDPSDHPHISYYDASNADLKYAHWNGSEWEIERVDSVDEVGEYSSLALDSNGYPYIAYYDYTNSALKCARWNGSSWRKEFVDMTGVVGMSCSIAVDAFNRPHISYYYENTQDLKYAFWNGLTWEIETVDGDEDVTFYNSIALDSYGYPHISYQARYDYLKYARWDGSNWNIDNVDSTTSGCTSITVDSTGLPHISYIDYTGGTTHIKYAHWDGFNWETETIYSTYFIGAWDCIALNSEDKPNVSYYHSSLGKIYHARKRVIDWAIRCTGEHDVGAYNSIAIDSSDRANLSYYDWDNGDLKYARYVSGTDIDLTSFKAESKPAGIDISWACERDDYGVAGFNLYRSTGTKDADVVRLRLNDELITGTTPYRYRDNKVEEGATYSYWLEALDDGGASETFGPVMCRWDGALPTGITLYQSKPNPGRGIATIGFELPETSYVTLNVYDSAGRKVATLVETQLPAGEHEREVGGLAPGVYVYRLEAEEFNDARKMVIIE